MSMFFTQYWSAAPHLECEVQSRITSKALEKFFLQVEKKAYRMAQLALGNSADALDVVQEAMMKMVERYTDRNESEWSPLFYRILQSKIMDQFRRRKLNRTLFFWRQTENETVIDEGIDYICPERCLEGQQRVQGLLDAVKALPLRQQQCFLLRYWEGMSTAETAHIMQCSEGSVKTHLSRANQALAEFSPQAPLNSRGDV